MRVVIAVGAGSEVDVPIESEDLQLDHGYSLEVAREDGLHDIGSSGQRGQRLPSAGQHAAALAQLFPVLLVLFGQQFAVPRLICAVVFNAVQLQGCRKDGRLGLPRDVGLALHPASSDGFKGTTVQLTAESAGFNQRVVDVPENQTVALISWHSPSLPSDGVACWEPSSTRSG